MWNNLRRYLLPWILVLAGCLFLPWLMGPYLVHLAITVFVYIALTLALGILTRTGQVSIGQSAFFGIGAYTAAVYVKYIGVNPLVEFLLGGAIASLFAIPIGVITLRLKGIYFSIATLAFSETLLVIANMERNVLGGGTGMAVPPLFGNRIIPNYYLGLSLCFGILLIDYLLNNTKLGFASPVIRHDERVASSIGINPVKYKIIAFLFSAFLTGIVGAYYMHYVTFAVPEEVFGFNISVIILAMAILGGIYSVEGTFIGAALLKITEEFLRLRIKYGYMVIYGIILIVVVLFMPNGIVGLFSKLKERGYFKLKRGIDKE